MLAWVADGDNLSSARYRNLIIAGNCWVAADKSDRPVAFLAASIEGDSLHIWELGVRSDLQRLGIGSALLDQAIRAGRHQGLAAVTLTTFRGIPWNAPFYERLGFMTLDEGTMDERLAGLLREDAERGLPMQLRCAMRLALLHESGVEL